MMRPANALDMWRAVFKDNCRTRVETRPAASVSAKRHGVPQKYLGFWAGPVGGMAGGRAGAARMLYDK